MGVASYTKNTLLGMLESFKTIDITVLAETLAGQKNSVKDQNIHVKRIWQRNNILSWIGLATKAVTHTATDVLIAFELSMFGGIISLFFIPLFIMVLRLAGKRVHVIAHHTITNLETVHGHTNTKKGSLIELIGTKMIRWFYRCLLVLSNDVVVFDEVFKQSLSQLSNKQNICVIPHGVELVNKSISTKQARKKLNIENNEIVIVSFGYLAWYKGTDWLVKTISNLPKTLQGKHIKLIIAGGPNPNRLDYPFYRRYVSSIETIAKQSHGKIHVTGYVSEEDIELYYQAADVIVYPYRTVFSASGPLSLAFSYQKPFLVSHHMTGMFMTSDIQEIFSQQQLNPKDITFSLTNSSFSNVLERIIIDKALVNKLINVGKSLSDIRSFTIIGKKHVALTQLDYESTSQRSIILAETSS